MKNAKASAAPMDLLLIFDKNPESLATLHKIADKLGCDRIETGSAADLREILAVRQPTIVALSVDHIDADYLEVLQALADGGTLPETLLIGSVHSRVLTSAKRAAASRGLPVMGTTGRPLDAYVVEKLLALHLSSAPPVAAHEVERALAEFELVLQYQPKVALGEDGLRVKGVEALARWQHPQRGMLYPHHFLSAFKNHNLMTHLTDYIMTETVRQAGMWRDCGLTPDIIVNLSPRLVQDRAFPDRLAILLQESGIPAQQLILDVAEAPGTEERDLQLDVFTRLRILGVGLCLDNFGTGVSSLTELYRMPFSEIKVDQSLIADVSREREAKLIVGAIADLAHTLQIEACAAGIETRETFEFVRSAGFDTAQGRFFSAPVDAADIETLINTWPRLGPAATGRWRMSTPINIDRMAPVER